MDRVSIVVPTYNRGDEIKQCIYNLLKQTYTDIEIVVVDDGSTDNTEEIIKGMVQKKVKYVKLDCNRGACYARNYGAHIATGRYVAFQDSDDLWIKNKLTKQVDFLLEKNADFVFCRLKTRRGNKDISFPDNRFLEKDVIIENIYQKNFGSTQTFLLKKECFDNVKFDTNLPRYQDWDFLISVMKKYTVAFMPETFVIQNVSDNQISANPKKGELACEYLLQKYADIYMDHPEWQAYLYYLIGTHKLEQGLSGYGEFKEAVRLGYRNYKCFCKLILSKGKKR